MAKLLRLPRKSVDILVIGIHNDSGQVHDLVKVQLESLRTRFFEEINCLVLTTLQQTMPTQYVDRVRLSIPPWLKLANPQFHKPAPIDAILGIQIIHKLLCVGKILVLDGSAALQKTRLGWILSGKIRGVTQNQRVVCNVASGLRLGCVRGDRGTLLTNQTTLLRGDRVRTAFSKTYKSRSRNGSIHRQFIV